MQTGNPTDFLVSSFYSLSLRSFFLKKGRKRRETREEKEDEKWQNTLRISNTTGRDGCNVVKSHRWRIDWNPKHDILLSIGIKKTVRTHTAAAGYRNRTSGGLTNVAGELNVWSFAPNSQTNVSNLNANSGNVNPLNWNNRANGFSVAACSEIGQKTYWVCISIFLIS